MIILLKHFPPFLFHATTRLRWRQYQRSGYIIPSNDDYVYFTNRFEECRKICIIRLFGDLRHSPQLRYFDRKGDVDRIILEVNTNGLLIEPDPESYIRPENFKDKQWYRQYGPVPLHFINAITVILSLFDAECRLLIDLIKGTDMGKLWRSREGS